MLIYVSCETPEQSTDYLYFKLMPIRTFSQDLKNFCLKISKKH